MRKGLVWIVFALFIDKIILVRKHKGIERRNELRLNKSVDNENGSVIKIKQCVEITNFLEKGS